MGTLRIKKTAWPDGREFKNISEYRKFLQRVNDFSLWIKRIKATKKVYYLDEA